MMMMMMTRCRCRGWRLAVSYLVGPGLASSPNLALFFVVNIIIIIIIIMMLTTTIMMMICQHIDDHGQDAKSKL